LIVPPKAKGKRAKDAITPLSGLNLAELLGPAAAKPKKISKENAVPEFVQRMSDPMDDISVWIDAVKQFEDIIRGFIKGSAENGDMSWERSIELIKVMRRECLLCELADPYNTFIRGIKEDLLNNKLGLNLRELWHKIKFSKVGLITEEDTGLSTVSTADAIDVCALPISVV